VTPAYVAVVGSGDAPADELEVAEDAVEAVELALG
jgi:hypothetical protein